MDEQTEKNEQTELLRRIDFKIDALDTKFEQIRTEARNISAITGGLAGGLVTTAIAFLRAKFGV